MSCKENHPGASRHPACCDAALHIKCRIRELPALVKAGRREAAGRLVQEINLLTSTTPALRATPPQLRKGVLPPRILFWCKAPVMQGGEFAPKVAALGYDQPGKTPLLASQQGWRESPGWFSLHDI